MSSQCFCSNWQTDDNFVCLCYDGEGEMDQREGETSDDNIICDGTETATETDGVVPDSSAVAERSRKQEESSESVITTGGEEMVVNSIYEKRDFANDGCKNKNSGNEDIEKDPQGSGSPCDKKISDNSVALPLQQSSSFSISAGVQDLKNFTETDSSLDPLLLPSGSLKETCYPTHYEWQVQDDDGNWVSYDDVDATMGSKVTMKRTTFSEDIERYYKSHPAPLPIFFTVNNQRCVLDLQNMTEHNQDGLQRSIRRVVKILAKKMFGKVTKPKKRFFKTRFNLPTKICFQSLDQQLLGSFLSSATEMSKLVGNRQSSSGKDITENLALPSFWNPMPDNDPYITVPLNTHSDEYTSLASLIKQTSGNLLIKRIVIVQNPEHFRAYEKRRASLKSQFPDILHKDQFLFHGTKPENVLPICKENLDWRLFGKANGHAHGRGVYFTNTVTTATLYASCPGSSLMGRIRTLPLVFGAVGPQFSQSIPFQHFGQLIPFQHFGQPIPFQQFGQPTTRQQIAQPTPAQQLAQPTPGQRLTQQTVRQLLGQRSSRLISVSSFSINQWATGMVPEPSTGIIFIVKVLIGRYTKGSPALDKPPNDKYGVPYDATVDDVWKPNIFVKYNSEEYYPLYYFEFEK